MSETSETTPEHPQVSTFNINDWLAEGKTGRTSKAVHLYNDVTLVERARELHQALSKVKEDQEAGVEAEESLAESNVRDMQAEYDELEERVAASRMEVTITGLTDTEVAEITTEFKRRHNLAKDKTVEHVPEGIPYILAEAATMPGGDKLTVDQWKAVEHMVGPAQWRELGRAYVYCQSTTPEVTVPFSQRRWPKR